MELPDLYAGQFVNMYSQTGSCAPAGYVNILHRSNNNSRRAILFLRSLRESPLFRVFHLIAHSRAIVIGCARPRFDVIRSETTK